MILIQGILFNIFFQVTTRITLTTLNNPCDHSVSQFRDSQETEIQHLTGHINVKIFH